MICGERETILTPIDAATIRPPLSSSSSSSSPTAASEDAKRDDEEARRARCNVSHITEIRQSTMIRISFEHSLHAQSSGIRMLDGDTFVLRVKYAAATNGENSPVGLRLRHRIESGGGSEQLVEHPLPLESTCEDVKLVFAARNENGDKLRDSEARVAMVTQIVDASGCVYAQVNWCTTLNDIFDFENP